MIFKVGMRQRGLKFYKNYINDDHWLTLTYFTARQNLAGFAFEWKKTVTKSF